MRKILEYIATEIKTQEGNTLSLAKYKVYGNFFDKLGTKARKRIFLRLL